MWSLTGPPQSLGSALEPPVQEREQAKASLCLVRGAQPEEAGRLRTAVRLAVCLPMPYPGPSHSWALQEYTALPLVVDISALTAGETKGRAKSKHKD